jgi:hypothetical protein
MQSHFVSGEKQTSRAAEEENVFGISTFLIVSLLPPGTLGGPKRNNFVSATVETASMLPHVDKDTEAMFSSPCMAKKVLSRLT